jgi:hypothetical protein
MNRLVNNSSYLEMLEDHCVHETESQIEVLLQLAERRD